MAAEERESDSKAPLLGNDTEAIQRKFQCAESGDWCAACVYLYVVGRVIGKKRKARNLVSTARIGKA
jgi:hypothetical protein